MSPEEISRLEQGLPALIFFAVPSALLFVLTWRGKVRFLRLAGTGERREPSLWTLAETILCLLVWYLGQIFFALLAFSILGPRSSKLVVALFAQVAATITACAFAFHVVKRVIGQPVATLGIAGTSPSSFAGILACHVFSFFPIQAISVLWMVLLHDLAGLELEAQDVVSEFRQYAHRGDIQSMLLFAVAGVLVAPIGEELIFRGVIHGYLRDRWGSLAGAVVSGAVFASVHRSLVGLVPLTVLGVLLARIYDRTGSLFPAMIFHAMYNATTIVFLSLSP